MGIFDTIANVGTLGGYGLVKGALSNPDAIDAPNAGNYQYGGTPGYAQQQATQFGGLAQAADQRGPPQFGYDVAGARVAMQDEGTLAGHYQRVLNGTAGPSLAELQMRQGLGQNTQNAYNIAANAGPQNAGLALHNAMLTQQQGGLAAAQQGGQLRAQEQQAAGQNLQGLYGSLQGQYAGLYGQQAQVELAQRGMNDARAQAMYQNQFNTNQAQLNAHMGLAGATQQATLANQQNQGNTYDRSARLLGGLAGAGAGMATGKG